MRRTLFLTAALALAATASFAQRQAAPAQITVISAAPNACPVGFAAGHSSGLTELPAKDARPGSVSQSLNVQLTNTGAHNIISAQITIHGLAPIGRITTTSSTTPSDVTRHLPLHLTVAAGHNAATDLRVYGLSSIQRIDLDSVAYADGTTWQASPHQRCSIAPSNVMLVAATAH